MSNDLRDLRLALRDQWQRLLVELLGQPSSKRSRHWRWNRRGSFVAVVSGPKAGTWFDHEVRSGGGPFELIIRQHGGDWRSAADWARRWLGWPDWKDARGQPAAVRVMPADDGDPHLMTPANDLQPDLEIERRRRAQRAAQAIWDRAVPADPSHPYLQRKSVPPIGVRMNAAGSLVIPLLDSDETIHTIQEINADGDKRYLAGGATSGHFAPIGDLPDDPATLLICEGWATGASAHIATGLPVIAAMDAGNLRAVAPILRCRFPAARIVLLADNDDKPGRTANPGVAAATAAARRIGGLIAIPPTPGDFNDLAVADGLDAVRAVIDTAAPPPPAIGTYPRPRHNVPAARALLDGMISRFMTDVAAFWNADPLARGLAFTAPANSDAADANTGGDVTDPPWFVGVDMQQFNGIDRIAC